jgi:hypothetical protein
MSNYIATNLIGVFAVGIFVGGFVVTFFMYYMKLVAQEYIEKDNATGTPIASLVAREMKLKYKLEPLTDWTPKKPKRKTVKEMK